MIKRSVQSRYTRLAGIGFGILFFSIWFWGPAESYLSKGTPALKVNGPRTLPIRATHAFTISPDGRYFASSDGRLLTIWDQEQRRATATIALDHAIEWLQFSASGRHLTLKTGDLFQTWDTHSWKVIDEKNVVPEQILIEALVTTKNRLIAARFQKDLTDVIDLSNGKVLLSVNTQLNGNYFSFDSSGQLAAYFVRQNKQIELHDLRSGEWVDTIDADPCYGGVSMSPNGRYVAWNQRGRVAVWDRVKKEETSFFAGQNIFTREFPGIAFSSDSSMIALASGSGIKIYGLTDHQLLADIVTNRIDFKSLDFSNDNTAIAVTYRTDPFPDLWEIAI
ncbi:WD40 repeat domain-containing protein [bacterium]|nr:WD40 repeat domain-containing protein [bacterium]